MAGVTNTFTESEGDLALAHTATGAGGEAIPFGVAVCSDGYATDGAVKKCYLPKTTYFTAQVATLDYTYNVGDILTVRCVNEMTGAVIAEYEYTTAVSKNASTTAILAALNQQAPANTVIFTTAAGDNIVATAEVAGLEFSVTIAGSATEAVSNVATTGPTIATSLKRAILGISMRDGSVVPTNLTDLTAEYPGNYPCTIASKGYLWVTNSQAPSFHDTVYVECDGTSAACGQLYNTSTATRLPLPREYAKWERAATTASGDSLAGLYINLTATK